MDHESGLNEKVADGVPKHIAEIAGVPKRWQPCPKYGKVVSNTFLPFKTPLSEGYDDLMEEEFKFYPQEIFNLTLDGAAPGAKVKLWINLANTTRFYGWRAVTSNDCKYIHLPLRGHNETPSHDDVAMFIDTVYNFKCSNPNDIVAIHCTHGFNRTGFLIVAYLVEVYGFPVATAIQEFAAARPNGIYKEDYLEDLFKRYDPTFDPERGLPIPVPAPQF